MALLLLVFLLALLLGALGFAVHILWIGAIAMLVLWLAGWAVGRGMGAGTSYRGWYHW